MMILQFETPVNPPMELFSGRGDPRKYLALCMEVWNKNTWNEWMHMSIHALGPIPTWYLDLELH